MGSYFIVQQIKNDLLKIDQMNERREKESDEGWKKGVLFKSILQRLHLTLLF